MRLRLRGRRVKPDSPSKSRFQQRIGRELLGRYPNDPVYEEVPVPGERLVLDFVIPSLHLVVECHGRQHTEYVHHFHGNRSGFHRQQDRDDRKRRWCALNNLRLIEVHDEQPD